MHSTQTLPLPTEEEAFEMLSAIRYQQMLEMGRVLESYDDNDPSTREGRRMVAAIHRLVFHPRREP
jgi:hypothetical protein